MHATLQTLNVRRPRGLRLDYDPELPLALLERLELAARRYGLPLSDLELLGQDAVFAQGFVDAEADEAAQAYLSSVDWSYLEEKLTTATYN